MDKFRVSNRVFWGAIVLCSSWLMGTAIGESDTFKAKKIEAHQISIVNEQGDAVISLETTRDGSPLLSVGKNPEWVSLHAGRTGPMLMVHGAKEGMHFDVSGIHGPFPSSGNNDK
jgi:hypothetical protein